MIRISLPKRGLGHTTILSHEIICRTRCTDVNTALAVGVAYHEELREEDFKNKSNNRKADVKI